METQWLDADERAAWLRLVAVVELLPGALDTQLRRDSGLTHFEYFVLAMLSEAPDRSLRMTALAHRTNGTLPRLSHVIARLEARGLVERFPCPEDRRATNARLTPAGWDTVVAAAPGHVGAVRHLVLDPLTRAQLEQLTAIGDALLTRLDPEDRFGARADAGQAPAPRRDLRSSPPSGRCRRTAPARSARPRCRPGRGGSPPGRCLACPRAGAPRCRRAPAPFGEDLVDVAVDAHDHVAAVDRGAALGRRPRRWVSPPLMPWPGVPIPMAPSPVSIDQ